MCEFCSSPNTPYITLAALLFAVENPEGLQGYINSLETDSDYSGPKIGLDSGDMDYLTDCLWHVIVKMRLHLEMKYRMEQGKRGYN